MKDEVHEYLIKNLINYNQVDNNSLKRVFMYYQEKLEYTKKIGFEDTINTIKDIVYILEQELIEM
ncbi:MAG: hypothetical protein ACI4U4_04945 [Bacilli bacterium]